MAEIGTTGPGLLVTFPSSVPDDHAFVDGLRRGDPATTRALHERFGRLVNRLVWRMLGADLDHDDVVHDVFVNILKSVKSLRDPSSLYAWVYGVTVNTGTRYTRAMAARTTAPEARAMRTAGREVRVVSCAPASRRACAARRSEPGPSPSVPRAVCVARSSVVGCSESSDMPASITAAKEWDLRRRAPRTVSAPGPADV
jgi:hypothetical protein